MIVSGSSGAHWANSRCQLVTSGLGQTSSTLRSFAGVQQQAHRRDRLHRFAQAHLVGQHRGVARIEKRDAFELIRKRLERKRQRAVADQRLERRLQHVVQPVLELDDVAGRLDPRARDGLPAAAAASAPAAAGRSSGAWRRRRPWHAIRQAAETES